MPEFLAAATSRAKPCFTIVPNEAGQWIARERLSGIERCFATQRAALHFVLFDLGAKAALVAPLSARVPQ